MVFEIKWKAIGSIESDKFTSLSNEHGLHLVQGWFLSKHPICLFGSFFSCSSSFETSRVKMIILESGTVS